MNKAYTRLVGAPKRKTVEFDSLTFTYDYEADRLIVHRMLSEGGDAVFTLSKTEIEELRAALRSFGLEVPSGLPNIHSGAQYR